ncbi:MAG TPA: hypothetical protein DCE41_17360 [Cytophagales bacterium]|nr:hypothetical protein [Cytophagales bacterium]
MSAGLLGYSSAIRGVPITLKTAGQFVGITTLIGVIPVVLRVAALNNILLRRNLEEVKALNASLQKQEQRGQERLIRLASHLVKESIETTTEQLVYLEAAQNYVYVGVLEKGVVSRKLLRLSMKLALDQVTDDYILRCHRSYVVNLRRVVRVESNAQGLRLRLEGVGKEVPVSRTYRAGVSGALKELR